MQIRLNPARQPLGARASKPETDQPSNPATIFPVPIRSWLPPAETPDGPRLLPGDHRIASSSVTPPSVEIPPLAFVSSAPAAVRLPVGPLIRVSASDPTRFTVRIASGPEVEATGSRPADRDRPQIADDPTADLSSEFVLATPPVLRESPPPFLRLSIPDPFDQISVAELANPPADNDAPVASFNRPPNSFLTEIPPAK